MESKIHFFWECYKVGKYQPRIVHPSPRGCLRKGHLGRGSTLSVANNKGLSKKVSNHIWNTRTLGTVSTCTTKHAFGTHVQSKEANQQQEEQKQQQSIAEETNDSVALPLLNNCATWIWISNFSYTNEKQVRLGTTLKPLSYLGSDFTSAESTPFRTSFRIVRSALKSLQPIDGHGLQERPLLE